MKRSLAVFTRSLLMPLLFILPTSLIQSSKAIVPQATVPIEREGKIIAQLQGFQSILELPSFNGKADSFNFKNKDLTELLNIENDEEWQKYFNYTLQWLFDPKEVCLNKDEVKENEVNENCKLTRPARRWLSQKIESIKYGVCEGMSTASLYLWLAKNYPEVYEERTRFYTDVDEFLEGNSASDLDPTERLLQEYIANLFVLQDIKEVYEPTQEIRENKKPSEILEQLIESMQSNPEDPYTMGIYRLEKDGELTQGHSITPFAVEDIKNGIYRVHVYDNNFPEETHYVEFDTKQETWRYQPGNAQPFEGTADTKNLDITRLSLRDLKDTEFFDCPFCDDNANSTLTDRVDVLFVGEGDVSMTDLKGNEIKNTDEIYFKGGLDKDVAPTLRLPPQQSKEPYKITVSGADLDQTIDAVMVGPDYVVGFEGISLDKQQQLVIYVYPGSNGPELTFEAHEEMEIPKVFIALEDDEKKNSYSFELSGIKISEGKNVTVVADINNRAIYFGDDDGQPDNYDLTMDFLSEKEEYILEVRDIQLEGQDIAYFDYGKWQHQHEDISQGKVDVPLYFSQWEEEASSDEEPFNIETDKKSYKQRVLRNEGQIRSR